MRRLFLDCSRGVSGDMLISSLLCHLKDERLFFEEMHKLGFGDRANISANDTVKYSVKGKTFEILAQNNLQKRYLDDIINIIDSSGLSKPVKNGSIKAFEALAETEGAIHGLPPEKVHFHEIGAVDTIFDITGFYVLLELLDIEQIINTPVNVGKGQLICEHGILPVPAPATAELLKGRQIFSFGEEGERATPTGAVLIRQSSSDGEMPMGRLVSIGYGFGTREFKDGNFLRSIIIDSEDCAWDWVYLLECNIDDMTGEGLGYAFEKLMEAGALDVWQQPLFMKKNRMGVKLSVLCRDADAFAELIFKHTTTLGIRISKTQRCLRGESSFAVKDGIRIKRTGDIAKAEFEDVKVRAETLGVSLKNIYKKLEEDNEH